MLPHPVPQPFSHARPSAAAMKTTHILNAASNLLGIALLIITGLHISNQGRGTIADEVAWGAAVLFSLSCLFSYQAIRQEARSELF